MFLTRSPSLVVIFERYSQNKNKTNDVYQANRFRVEVEAEIEMKKEMKEIFHVINVVKKDIIKMNVHIQKII